MAHIKEVCNTQIVYIRDNPQLIEQSAKWFSSKWGIDEQAYLESMQSSLLHSTATPQWYLAMNQDTIIGGAGVIENDFHERSDLSPNVCALYVDSAYRNKGIAGQLLHAICIDMASFDINTLYLVTDHTTFYEKYGWSYLCAVNSVGQTTPSRLYIHTTN